MKHIRVYNGSSVNLIIESRSEIAVGNESVSRICFDVLVIKNVVRRAKCVHVYRRRGKFANTHIRKHGTSTYRKRFISRPNSR